METLRSLSLEWSTGCPNLGLFWLNSSILPLRSALGRESTLADATWPRSAAVPGEPGVSPDGGVTGPEGLSIPGSVSDSPEPMFSKDGGGSNVGFSNSLGAVASCDGSFSEPGETAASPDAGFW